MVGVFMSIRPYKDDTVNIFSIINESVLVIIGFYLFFFIDQSQATSKNSIFYGKFINPLI